LGASAEEIRLIFALFKAERSTGRASSKKFFSLDAKLFRSNWERRENIFYMLAQKNTATVVTRFLKATSLSCLINKEN
jgi:hypothetical protein